jgi:hypothetical protein
MVCKCLVVELVISFALPVYTYRFMTFTFSESQTMGIYFFFTDRPCSDLNKNMAPPFPPLRKNNLFTSFFSGKKLILCPSYRLLLPLYIFTHRCTKKQTSTILTHTEIRNPHTDKLVVFRGRTTFSYTVFSYSLFSTTFNLIPTSLVSRKQSDETTFVSAKISKILALRLEDFCFFFSSRIFFYAFNTLPH